MWLILAALLLITHFAAVLKEGGGYRRIGTLLQLFVLACLLCFGYEARQAGEVDNAIYIAGFFGMQVMAMAWSSTALTHRHYAHKDQPDLSLKEGRQEIVRYYGEMAGGAMIMLIIALILTVLWMVGKALF